MDGIQAEQEQMGQTTPYSDILVQQSTTVSFAGFPVQPMSMHKVLIVEIVSFVFYKGCSF